MDGYSQLQGGAQNKAPFQHDPRDTISVRNDAQKHDLLDGATAAERKKYPVKTGFLDYFRDAILRCSRVSYEGNVQHNGEGHPLQWTRGLSADHEDCLVRHMMAGDEEEHLASAFWRAGAALQMYLEKKYNIKPPPACK